MTVQVHRRLYAARVDQAWGLGSGQRDASGRHLLSLLISAPVSEGSH
ncbi:hypothetical protein [Williamsia sp.]